VPPPFNYAFAIVDERAVVFSVAPQRSWGMTGLPITDVLSAEQLEAVLASFRFLGEAPSPSPDGAGDPDLINSFEVTLPDGWRGEWFAEGFHASGDGSSLTIRLGTPDGRLVTCEVPGRPWERCRDRVVPNLEAFREAVATGPPEGCGWCVPPATETSSTLGGEESWQIDFFGYEYPARSSETARYVLAIHDGRPYFVRFHTSANGPQPDRRALWDEILETFAFLD
jgi:hypothetical protein